MADTFNQIEKYLSSEDLEMIQLGVTMLSSLPDRLWEGVLKNTIKPPYNYVIRQDEYGEKYINVIRTIGLYEQLNNKYKAIYMKEAFSLQLLQEKLNKYYDKDQQQQSNRG